MSCAIGTGHALITRRAALLGLAAGSAMLSAPAIARAEDEWDKIVDGARKEGHVVLYSAFVGLAAHQELKKDFEATYGITVDILEARASEVRERIRIEQAAGRFAADVSENGRTTTTLQIDAGSRVRSVRTAAEPWPSEAGIPRPTTSACRCLPSSTASSPTPGWSSPRTNRRAGSISPIPAGRARSSADDFRALGGGGVLFYRA